MSAVVTFLRVRSDCREVTKRIADIKPALFRLEKFQVGIPEELILLVEHLVLCTYCGRKWPEVQKGCQRSIIRCGHKALGYESAKGCVHPFVSKLDSSGSKIGGQ